MSENNEAVKADAQIAAAGDGVSQTPIIDAGADLVARLAEKDAEIAKLRDERESYRIAMLKAKGKLGEEGLEEEREATRAMIREELAASQEAQLIRQKESILTALKKENAELKVALKSKAGASTTAGAGGNQEQPAANKTSLLSDAQKANLRNKWVPLYGAEKTEKMIADMEKRAAGNIR